MPRGSNAQKKKKGFQPAPKLGVVPPAAAPASVPLPRRVSTERITVGENGKPCVKLSTLSRYAEHLELAPRPVGHPLHYPTQLGVSARFVLSPDANIEDVTNRIKILGYRTLSVLGNHRDVDAPNHWKVVKSPQGSLYAVSPAYPNSPASIRLLREVERSLRRGLFNRRRVVEISLESE